MGVFTCCGEQRNSLDYTAVNGADGKGDKMEGCHVMEGPGCLPRHPSILAYTSKGHTYSMTGLPQSSPSCPAPPSQLSWQLCALQPPPTTERGHRGELGAPPSLQGHH